MNSLIWEMISNVSVAENSHLKVSNASIKFGEQTQAHAYIIWLCDQLDLVLVGMVLSILNANEKIFVTKSTKIDHLSTKYCQFFALFYHNLISIYTTTTKSSPLLYNLTGILQQHTEMGYYILNGRY